LTDGRDKNYVKGRQIEYEWKIYQNLTNILQNSSIPVLDIRGNHDVYGSKNSSFYQKYGSSKIGNAVHSFSFGSESLCYDYLPVDCAPLPGVGRPLNFVGYCNETIAFLKNYTTSCNFTTIYGHYPLSSIKGRHVKELIAKKGNVYLSGHYHQYIAPKMYGMHRFKHHPIAEFEISDWRDHRWIRIITLDDGIFGFRDIQYADGEEKKVVAHILSPKGTDRMLIGNEPVDRSIESEFIHLAVYVFNSTETCSVRNGAGVFLKGGLVETKGDRSFRREIYIFEFVKSAWPNSTIKFDVVCGNISATDSVTFVADVASAVSTMNENASWFVKIGLLTNIPIVAGFLFYLGIIFTLSILFIMKKQFSANQDLWKLLVYYGFWLALGPWFFGKMIEQRSIVDGRNFDQDDPSDSPTYGIMFAFGIVIFDSDTNLLNFITDHTSYLIGCTIIATFYFPIVFLSKWYLHWLETHPGYKFPKVQFSMIATVFVVFLLFHVNHFYEMVLAYGSAIWILSPVFQLMVGAPLVMLTHKTRIFIKTMKSTEVFSVGRHELPESDEERLLE